MGVFYYVDFLFSNDVLLADKELYKAGSKIMIDADHEVEAPVLNWSTTWEERKEQIMEKLGNDYAKAVEYATNKWKKNGGVCYIPKQNYNKEDIRIKMIKENGNFVSCEWRRDSWLILSCEAKSIKTTINTDNIERSLCGGVIPIWRVSNYQNTQEILELYWAFLCRETGPALLREGCWLALQRNRFLLSCEEQRQENERQKKIFFRRLFK